MANDAWEHHHPRRQSFHRHVALRPYQPGLSTGLVPRVGLARRFRRFIIGELGMYHEDWAGELSGDHGGDFGERPVGT